MTDAIDIPPAFDGKRFREVLGHYPTGVALVTGVAPDGELLAMVVGTFSSVSLDPPLVSFMTMRTSRTFARLRECRSLCICVLGAGQEEAVRSIASHWEDKFAGLDWAPSPSGDPVLDGSMAWLDTRIDQVVEAGDHDIVLCRVVAMEAAETPGDPLIFYRGGYGTFIVPSLVTGVERDIAPAVLHAEAARPVLESLAADLGCEAAMMHRCGDELVAVASAVGRDLSVTCALGLRVPVIPPVGDVFVAFDDEAERERWLSHVDGGDPTQEEVYRERLEFARTHGYLMSFQPPGHGPDWMGLTSSLGHRGPGHITEEQERALHDALQWSPAMYRPRELSGDESFDLGSLVVPIHNHDGRTLRSLRLSQLPQGVGGDQARHWLDRLLLAAERVEALLG